MKFGIQIENTFGNNFGYRDIADLACGGVAYITTMIASGLFSGGGGGGTFLLPAKESVWLLRHREGEGVGGAYPLPLLCELDIVIDC